MTKPPLAKPQLDAILKQGCGDPTCTHHHKPLDEIFLSPKCHPSSGVVVSYSNKGILKIVCKECKKYILEIHPFDIPTPLWEASQRAEEVLNLIGEAERTDGDTKRLYFQLAMMRDMVSYHHPPGSVEALVAQRGALRAALKSGQRDLATRMLENYTTHPNFPKEKLAELQEIMDRPEEAL